jgi:signal transduction histidine kinase
MSELMTNTGRPVPGPVPWAYLGALLLGALALLVALDGLMDAGARVRDAGVQRFDGAFRTVGEVETGPLPMRLPRNCHAQGECVHAYRIRFDHDAATDERFALYVPQFTGRMQVSLNGVPMLDSTLGETSLRQGQGAPQIASVPERLLRPGANEIGVVLAERLGSGAVGPVFFGPEERLRGEYEAAYFVVMTLSRLMDGALLAIGSILLLIWMARRQDQLYLLCAAISLSFALTSLSPIIASAFGDFLLVPVNTLRFVAACLLLPFIWQLTGRRAPLRTRWFLVPGALMVLAFHALPAAWSMFLLWALFIPLALGLAALALRELWRAGVRGRDRTALILLVAIGVLLALAVRDQLVLSTGLGRGYVQLARFNGPILVFIMGVILLRSFAEGLSLLEDFNARLRRDVAAAREQLQQAFQREQAQARRQTLAAERMRLMGDLHDGIAGQLVSIVSLSERGEGPVAREVARACHGALTDLRLVVDSMEDFGDDLGMMLVAFRDRVEPQLRRSGLRLEWKVHDLPDLPGLSPTHALGLFRLLQEAVNNAARHSGSDVVAVESPRVPGPGVRLVVSDRGRGGAQPRRGHYGMDNMQRRANDLGARLTVESDARGTRVIVDLPERLAAREGALRT